MSNRRNFRRHQTRRKVWERRDEKTAPYLSDRPYVPHPTAPEHERPAPVPWQDEVGIVVKNEAGQVIGRLSRRRRTDNGL